VSGAKSITELLHVKSEHESTHTLTVATWISMELGAADWCGRAEAAICGRSSSSGEEAREVVTMVQVQVGFGMRLEWLGREGDSRLPCARSGSYVRGRGLS
jgi:hypothetical protein